MAPWKGLCEGHDPAIDSDYSPILLIDIDNDYCDDGYIFVNTCVGFNPICTALQFNWMIYLILKDSL